MSSYRIELSPFVMFLDLVIDLEEFGNGERDPELCSRVQFFRNLGKEFLVITKVL